VTEFLQSLVRGLGTGSVYALLAIGFVIIYKSTRVISFAQPAFMVTGAVAVAYLVQAMSFYVAVLLAIALTTLLALGVERAAIRPMIGRPAFVVAIITLGVDVVVRARSATLGGCRPGRSPASRCSGGTSPCW
jgi:branched-chain amino acid transport system permease protein